MLVLRRSVLLWSAIYTFIFDSACAKKKETEVTGVVLPHHSFATPLEYPALLQDWTVSGASLFVRERLLLHPGILERHGFSFNTQPLLTPTFEVRVHFFMGSTTAEASEVVPSDQSFAIWLVDENVSQSFVPLTAIKAPSWKQGLEVQDFTFSGSKAKFKGAGAVFAPGKDGKPSISFVRNENDRALSFDADVKPSQTVNFRNTRDPVQFRLRVRRDGIQGSVLVDGQWFDCGSDNVPLVQNPYLGFTAWSGTTDSSSKQRSDLLSIVKVEVINLDDSSIGELASSKDVATDEELDEVAKLLKEREAHLGDSQQAHLEHLGRLTHMLEDHQLSIMTHSTRVKHDLEAVNSKLQTFDKDCRTLTREMHLLWKPKQKGGGETDRVDHIAAMRDTLRSLKKQIVKDSKSDESSLEDLSVVGEQVLFPDAEEEEVDEKELEKLAEQSISLAAATKNRVRNMILAFGGVAGTVVLVGFLVWCRMTSYEKKHFI